MRPEFPSRLDSHLDAFDAAWQQSDSPRLDDFLPPPADSDRQIVLVGLVRIDMERRIKRGEPIRVENYLSRFPELRQDAQALLGLVQLERVLRQGHDPAFDGGHYPERFPELNWPADLADQTTIKAGLSPSSTGRSNGDGAALDLREYVLLDIVGQGGMGEVYRGRDPALNRSLAVKVLRSELRGHPEAERRFEQEARINGVLQHPSIVPVHNLGRLPDGRLYFTMKLVRGRTLADLLGGSGERPGRLPELLGIFEKVCQAVAYAHSRMVIHRDLKPQNVMVGAFGEVQVMDWGLAKVVSRRPRPSAGESTLGVVFQTKRPDSTAGGQEPTGVVGTPAYMAPEQARGESEEMDERTDVFGLGGILCAILTGQPPFTGDTRDEVLRKAEDGELAEALARLNACGADAELVELCRECLAPRREKRPGDAGVVAERVAAYQTAVQERLRKAELQQAAAEARAAEEAKTRRVAEGKAAAERRARRLTVGLAAAALLAAGAVGVGAWLVNAKQQEKSAVEQRRRQEARGEMALLLNEARLLRTQAAEHPLGDAERFHAAAGVAGRAVKLAEKSEAGQELRPDAVALAEQLQAEAVAAEKDHALLRALLEVRVPRQPVTFVKDKKGVLMAVAEPNADEKFAAAFRAWDATLDVDTLPTEEAAARLRSRPAAVRDEIVAALDEWAVERWRAQPRGQWQRITDLAAALDSGPGAARRADVREMMFSDILDRDKALGMLSAALRPVPVPFDAGLSEGRGRLRQLAAEVDVKNAPPLELLTLARAFAQAEQGAEAERLLRAAVRARPTEVTLQAALGQLLSDRGRWGEAVEFGSAVRALRPELGAVLAQALLRSRRTNEGVALYHQLIAERPDNAWLYSDLGGGLVSQARYQEAEVALREAIRLHPNDPVALSNLSGALAGQGHFKDAEKVCREAIQLKADLSPAHFNLGCTLDAQHRFPEAEKAYREAIRLAPHDTDPYINLSALLDDQEKYEEAEKVCRAALLRKSDFDTYNNLGVALNGQMRFKEAETALREALRLNPHDVQAHYNLGRSLAGLGRLPEAERECRKAVFLKPDDLKALNNLASVLGIQNRLHDAEEIRREVVRLYPKSPEAQFFLGNILARRGKQKDAEAAFREAIALDANYGLAHYNLGIALSAQGRYKDAEEPFRTAIRLQPEFPDAFVGLGTALSAQHQFKDAERAFLDAIRLNPHRAEAHNNLGMTLLNQGRWKDAEKACREAVRLRHDYPEAHYNLGLALVNQGLLKDAETAYREAIRLKPDFARAHCDLGLVLSNQGRLMEALEEFRQGDTLGRREPGWRVPSGELVKMCERLIELDRKLPAILRGEAEPASAGERLELASYCRHPTKRLYAASARFAVAAFSDDRRLADNLFQQSRYFATCSAAQAAAGEGEDAAHLPDKEQLMLRRQALAWLRADLTAYTQFVNRADLRTMLRQRLDLWRQDPALASVRDKEALNKLPEDERKHWRELWDAVERLSQQIADAGKRDPRPSP